jgi:transcriptional regulator with XRE-family HTH domain
MVVLNLVLTENHEESREIGMAELDLLIGKRLQTARKALGFKSARSFARQHGIPESTYSQHETGKRSLNPTTMVAYCERLKIKPGWLITGEDSSSNKVDLSKLQTSLHERLSRLVNPSMQVHLKTVLGHCFAGQAATQTKALDTVE